MITYQVELFRSIISEIKPLIQDHWEEIALNKDKIKLSPDWKKATAMDLAGMLHTVTVRDNTKLVGYFICIIDTALHYKDNLFATNDILFIDKVYRGSTIGYRMFKYAEDRLKELGVDVIYIHMKTDHMFDKLVHKLGYNHTEELYSKYIGD